MAALSQKDQLAFHEFSVRYRAALAQKHQASQKSLDTFKGAVREQYETEKEAEQNKEPEPQVPTK